MSKPSYETWLISTRAVVFTDSTVVICTPNNFARDWLENRYTKHIKEAVYDYSGKQIELKFIIESDDEPEESGAPSTPVTPAAKAKPIAEEPFAHMMNPKYTFDTFVIGAGNRFAHAASLAVAEAPAKAYNPLFLYGGVGLGKNALDARHRPLRTGA